jgi:ABC-type Fe3+ transport system permease subunit
VAAETLISFSAFHDAVLAGRQSLALSMTALLIALPLAGILAPRLADALLVKQSREFCRMRHVGAAVAATLLLSVVGCVGFALPLVGLGWPCSAEDSHAAAELSRTSANTILYGIGAGVLAAVLATVLAMAVGRSGARRVAAVAALFVLLALPSTVSALGAVQLGTTAPAWLDALLRSRMTVCIVLGLRYAPVAALLMVRAWAASSPTWTYAAAIHGVSLVRYLVRVLIPQLSRAIGAAAVAVGLLATGDVGTVLLVHPPGEASFPLAIFTVMANAPEGLVASMCLMYLIGAALLLAVIWRVGEGIAT